MLKRLIAFALAGCMMFESVSLNVSAETNSAYTETTQIEAISGNDISGNDVSENDISENDILESAISENEIAENDVEIESSVEEIFEEEISETEPVAEETEEILDVTAVDPNSVIPLSFGASNTISLGLYPDGEYYKWYSFTAPEDGYYHFYAAKIAESSKNNKAYMYKTLNNGAILKDDVVNKSSELTLRTDKLKTGDTIYLKIYTYESAGLIFDLEVQKLPEYSLVKQENGSFVADVGNYTFSVATKAGYKNLRGDISLAPKEEAALADYVAVRILSWETGSTTKNEQVSYGYADSDYQMNFSLVKEFDTEYNLSFVLEGTNTVPVAIFDGDILLKTGKSDADLFIHETTSTFNSVTFDMECFEAGYCYYTPVDGSESEKNVVLSEGWRKIVIKDLKPETEYLFEFANNNGKLLHTTKVSTKPDTTEITYDVSLSEKGTTLYLKATVDKYTYSDKYVRLYYEYTDALGNVNTSYISRDAENAEFVEGEGKSIYFDSYHSNPLFLANTTYDIKLWIQVGNTKLAETVQTVTAKEATVIAEDISFAINASEEVAGQADYQLQIANLSESKKVHLYYKQQGAEGNYTSFATLDVENSDSVTGSVTGLQSGATYDFVLFVGGIKKEITATIGAEMISLTKVGEDTVNFFDFVRTFKLESTEELADTYSLNLYYWTGSSYAALGSTVSLNADNNYQVEYKSADLDIVLKPDTKYELKWTVKTGGKTVYSSFEAIQTAPVKLSVDSKNSLFNQQDYTVTLDAEGMAVYTSTNYTKSFSVSGYIRKKGETSYRKAATVSLWNNKSWSGTLSFKGLEENSTYEVSLRNNEGCEYVTFSFDTPKDIREITVTKTKTTIHTGRIEYEFSGTGTLSGYIHLYLREKGTEEKWEKIRANSFNSQKTTGAYDINSYKNGEKLKEATCYEYLLGFGSEEKTEFSKLEKTITGEITTAKDNRVLKNSATIGYVSALMKFNMTGNDSASYSNFCFFYREKGEAEWLLWKKSNTYNETASYNYTITGLESGTTYEYAIVIADEYNCNSPDEVAESSRKIVSEFTTLKNEYVVDFTVNESKTTNSKAVVAVTVSGNTRDEFVRVTLTLDDGQEQTVDLKRSNGYTKNVTFMELLGEREYTITKAVFSVTENNAFEVIGEQACDYKFTTKKAEAPTSITLSETALTLNAVYAGKYLEGFSSKRLKTEVEPETAEAEVVWSSSDEKVATVEDGIVYAQGVGNAVITVTSAYDESVKATCEVTVKNYAIGYTDATGAVQILTDTDTYSIYKNSSLEGFGLYEIASDKTATALSDFNVIPVKEGIVTWTADKELQAIGVGQTRVDFEKDSVKAAIYVNVTAAGKGFGITGFTSINANYPAVREEDGSYTLAYRKGVYYKTNGEISPEQTFQASDFTWTISDTTVATVSDEGVITPLQPGKVTLTVTSQNYLSDEPYIQKEVSIDLNIEALPETGEVYRYALANVYQTIGEVPLHESWQEGWTWKYPDTPLVTNSVYTNNSYKFEVIYMGEDGYPLETTLQVYIGRITGASVAEKDGAHKQVLEAGGADSLTLSVAPITQGKVSKDDYIVDIPNDIEGLTVTNVDGIFTVTAQKAGNYTLKPVIKSAVDDSVFATANYKITAVEEKQVASITLTTDTEGIVIEDNTVIFDTVDAKKNFTLKAEVKDRYGEPLETALQWKITDKKVANVATKSAKETREATVTVKGEGHAVIMIKAKDKTGYLVEFNVEVQNHAPRVDKNKVNVNIAYDYNSADGKRLASSAGTLEIIPVYGETVSQVQLFDEKGENVESNLTIETYEGYKYLVRPIEDEIKTGMYKCTLRVTTDSGRSYDYKLQVNVTDKQLVVSAKMNEGINLFYTNTTGKIELKLSDNGSRIERFSWWDESEYSNDGFKVTGHYSTNSSTGAYTSYFTLSQYADIKVINGKLQDSSVAKMNIKVKFTGYRKEYAFEKFDIKYYYKKPSIITRDASTNVVLAAGQNTNKFSLYDNTNKRYIYYRTQDLSYYYYFSEVLCENDVKLTMKTGSATINYIYNGKVAKENLILTVDSLVWREPVEVTHTIKDIKPKAYLSNNVLTYNTFEKSAVTTSIYIKNTKDIDFSDIVVKGANEKAQKLLRDDLLMITTNTEDNNQLQIVQSDSELVAETIPAGTYSYKVTPYYTHSETGEKVALNTLTLKIKVVNKPVTVKVTPKGSIDLANGTSISVKTKRNAIWVDPKFSNWASGYSISSYKLIGEYSDYFKMAYTSSHYYMKVDGDDLGKLKAGQTYRLAVQFTIENTEGDTFTIISNTFNVKPKQSKPKVTVNNNNQTLYAAADGVYRTYHLSVPGYYTIEEATGSLDCNKDGKADIVVSGDSSVNVKIVDRDAVVATEKGKIYNVPVIVKVTGRDGIGKDATVKIKVKVKR